MNDDILPRSLIVVLPHSNLGVKRGLVRHPRFLLGCISTLQFPVLNLEIIFEKRITENWQQESQLTNICLKINQVVGHFSISVNRAPIPSRKNSLQFAKWKNMHKDSRRKELTVRTHLSPRLLTKFISLLTSPTYIKVTGKLAFAYGKGPQLTLLPLPSIGRFFTAINSEFRVLLLPSVLTIEYWLTVGAIAAAKL